MQFNHWPQRLTFRLPGVKPITPGSVCTSHEKHEPGATKWLDQFLFQSIGVSALTHSCMQLSNEDTQH